jgi:lysosomal alpha-mannosidase
VSEALPLNVHLLTFDQLTSKTYLVRIEHYFELNEDESYSKPVQFDLQSLFNALGKVSDSVELTLAGNLPLSEMNRLVWRTNDNESSYWKPTGMTIKFV